MPKRIPFEQLKTGRWVCYWVELVGIILSVRSEPGSIQLNLRGPAGDFLVIMHEFPQDGRLSVGSKVIVRGALSALYNDRRQALGVKLFVPGPEDSMPFRLREHVARILKPLAFRADEKRLELLCNIRPDVPDRIIGDPARIGQIIINLVGNAIKFTSRGEVELGIELDGIENESAELHFCVRDTGIGIPPDKQRLIFDAFRRRTPA